MKAYFLFIAAGLMGSAAAAQTGSDFRGFMWGTSFNDVLANEKATFLFKENDNLLEYKDTLAGSDCNVSYSFNDNNKLISGNYIFTRRYPNPQLYVEDYMMFKNLLISKYGKPVTEKVIWSNNTADTEKHNYGQALADGNLKLITTWTTGRSIIQVIAAGYDKRPTVYIHYTARTLNKLQDARLLNEALKKL